MELILAALIAGATAATKDTAGVAVKDAYEGLKALIKKKFEKDALAQAMVDAKPEDIQNLRIDRISIMCI
jgi:disulfide oxidoreductase YuzD